MTGHFAGPAWSRGAGRKVSSLLAGVADAVARRGATLVRSPAVRIDDRGRVQVRVAVRRIDASALAELAHAGLHVEIANARAGAVRGWVAADQLLALAALGNVRRVTPPDYARPHAGSVEGAHDAKLGCEELRSRFGVDGRDIRVGVISDGIDHIADSQASGDAPAVVVPDDPRCHPGGGDEGSAMIELVHDCAPGATIGFCGPADDLEMIDCAACLQQAFGADVIVDDLAFPAQPFFADGPVADAVQEAVRSGVAWFSAAGNSGQTHYQGRYKACQGSDRQEFIGSGCTLNFWFAGDLQIVLQWDDPFGAAANDYDLCVPGLGCSNDPQNGTQDPIEGVVVSCGWWGCMAGLEIYKRAGVAKDLEVYFEPLSGGVELFGSRIPGDSIFGHACVDGVFAVGAIDAGTPGLDTIEDFSSRGPCTIKFPQLVKRPKPDFAGVDGIANTGPGGFPSPFYGTSAAAPGVAAVAALLLDFARGLALDGLRYALRASAVDLGVPGFDAQFGYGRVDAVAAAAQLPPITPRAPTPTPTPSPTPGLCRGDCDGNGRVTVDELLRGVRVALGDGTSAACPGLDRNGDGLTTIDDLVAAVASALQGCVGASFTPAPAWAAPRHDR